jgi:hypothetical protein
MEHIKSTLGVGKSGDNDSDMWKTLL